MDAVFKIILVTNILQKNLENIDIF